MTISKINLIDMNMRKDKKCGKYLFTLTYHATHRNGAVDEYILKDVENPFGTDCFEIYRDSIFYGEKAPAELVLDDKRLHILGGDIICQRIKEPDPIDVTMEDIEKKFGCPVKIVKSKEDK